MVLFGISIRVVWIKRKRGGEIEQEITKLQKRRQRTNIVSNLCYLLCNIHYVMCLLQINKYFNVMTVWVLTKIFNERALFTCALFCKYKQRFFDLIWMTFGNLYKQFEATFCPPPPSARPASWEGYFVTPTLHNCGSIIISFSWNSLKTSKKCLKKLRVPFV